MSMNIDNLPRRKANRLGNYDYNLPGAYFLTICTKGRKEILSKIIVGTGVLDCPEIELLKYGIIADQQINKMKEFYDNISIEKYVIMPNHIHLVLRICYDLNGQLRTAVPTLGYYNIRNQNSVVSKFVGTFKRFTNKEYGLNIWQDRYYDHIIRCEQDFYETCKYIDENPAKWCCERKDK